jgi:NAD(P)-dependent dehydrogenase (short-subunit alcohol dehydrogenase family)
MAKNTYKDKVCIVTGGASGLGRALCAQLAVAGGAVIVADIDLAAAEDLARRIRDLGGTAKAVRTDVTDSESVRGLIEGAASDFGRIDYLFNNAGIAIFGEIRDLSLEHWRRVIDINLLGEIYGIHYAYPLMIKQGFGHIVNVASGFGMAPGPLNSPYVASKFAVFGISHALATEARAFGVHVTVACPGYIKTPLVDNIACVQAAPADVLANIPVAMVPVDRAASLILAGVTKRKMVVAFPGYVGVLAFVHRFLPGLWAMMGKSEIARFRKIRQDTAPA